MSLLDFNATRLSFKRPITSYTKVQSVLGSCFRRFHNVINRDRVQSLQYLNFGCGPNVHTSFINLDFAWGPRIDICCDITQGLPLPSRSLDGIFTEHCLEHIAFDACCGVLKECHRVLRPGATLRIVVPDAGLFANLYVQAQAGAAVQFPYARDYPTSTPMMHLNRIFRDHGHLFAYDVPTLSRLLNECGFVEVVPCSFRQGRNPNLLLDSEVRACESLYVEAHA